MALVKLNNQSISEVTGLPAGVGGKVLQVVQGSTISQVVTATTTTTDTGLSASITPSSASSKIVIVVAQSFYLNGENTISSGSLFLVRGATTIGNTGEYSAWSSTYTTNYQDNGYGLIYSINYLDSPSTTSSTTYKTQQKLRDGNRCETQRDGTHTSYIILMEIGA